MYLRCLHQLSRISQRLSSIARSTSSTKTFLDEDFNENTKPDFHMKSRRFVGIYNRHGALQQSKIVHPKDHPKIVIRRMELALLDELLRLYEKNSPVTLDIVEKLYDDAIRGHTSEELPAQLVVEVLTSLLSNYDLDWIRNQVIPLVPDATDKLGKCSYRVLYMCLISYRGESRLTSDIDEFVCRTYDRLVSSGGEESKSGLYTGTHLRSSMHKTVSLSSR